MGRFLFVLCVGLAGTAILVGLGIWQLQRLAWKESILAEIETRIASDPVALPDMPDPDRDRYLSVRAKGTILDGEIHVLVSIKRVGPGYRIIAPFELEDGRRVLLDRGFVPEADKTGLRPTGPTELSGNLHWPQEIDGFTPDPDLAGNTWFARDVPAMAGELGTAPVMIVADGRSGTVPGVTPLPLETAGIPNDHLQYAITWFSLAIIWVAMSFYFLSRGRREAEKEGL